MNDTAIVDAIRETLWPDGNAENEWSPDTLDAIADVLNQNGRGPGSAGDVRP